MSTVNLENTCRNLYSSSVTEPNKLTSHGHQVHFQPEKSLVRVTCGYRADASINLLCNVLLRQRALTGGDLVSVVCLASPAWLFDTISAAAHSLSDGCFQADCLHSLLLGNFKLHTKVPFVIPVLFALINSLGNFFMHIMTFTVFDIDVGPQVAREI